MDGEDLDDWTNERLARQRALRAAVLIDAIRCLVGAGGTRERRARQSALRQILHTFFDGSTEQAVAALLDLSSAKLSDEELDRLSRMIADARKEGR